MSTAPLVFAHRGASAALPEHTLAAYLQALDDGADGLECDVRLTRDGHLVCLHDRRLDRVSNGRGVVSAHTLDQLELLDFGSWRGTGPARLLTLDGLLRAVRAAGRPVRLLIETKHPSRYGPAVERRLVALLRQHELAEPAPGDPVRATVMSFSALALRRVRQLAPALPTVLLLELLPPGVCVPWPFARSVAAAPARLPNGGVGGAGGVAGARRQLRNPGPAARNPRLGRLPFGATIAGPSIGLVRARPALLPALRAAGSQVYVWTVNEPADLELVRAQQVDGVITDRPAETLAALGR